jgi:hypothetical protein
MKTLRKHLCSGGMALALCMLALAARAQYSNAVLSLNPVLYYHLNETTPVPGVLWTNWGTAGNVGTLFGVNSPSFQVTPGALPAEPGNGAAGFDGTDNYAFISYSAAIDPSKGNPQAPFTIEGWYNPATSSPSGGNGSVIYFANVGGETGWNLYQDSSVGWDWQLYKNSGSNLAARVSSGSPAAAGVFSHVVLVWDGTNASEYVNGALAAGPTPAPTFVPIGYDSGGDSAWIVSIGSQNYLGPWLPVTTFWGGSAQEVAVYTNALSAATILAHYQNGTNRAPAQTYESLVTALNPLLYYRLNDPAYTDQSLMGVKPAPFQPGQPLAENLGSLGTNYDGTYEPGAMTGIPGAPYAGFGSNNYAVFFNSEPYVAYGAPDTINFTSVEIPPAVTLTNVADFTFTCWFYNNSYQGGAAEPLMCCRLAADEESAATALWSWNQTNLSTQWNGADYASSYGSLSDPPVAAWSFVAAVWTPTNTTVFVNGVATTLASGHTPIDFSTMGPIVLGDDLNIPYGQALNGLMQEVAIFTNALSLAQLQSLYNAGGQPPQAVSVTQSPPGPTNYEGQTITLAVTNYGSGPLAYQWLESGQQLTGQTGSSLVLNNVVTTNSGYYSVAVSSPYGAVTSSVVTLDVVAGPPVIVQQPTPDAVSRYPDGYVRFTVAALGSPPITYQWRFDNAPISGATSTDLTLTALTAANAGSYNVVVSNPHGSVTTSNAVLTVWAAEAQYSNAVLSLNPILYYHLNDTTPVPGNVWTNAGTAGAAGTLFGLNSPSFQVMPGALAAEPSNGAAGFDGSTMYAPLPYSPAIDPSEGDPNAPFTVEGWFNPATSTPGDGCVMNYVNMGGRTGWILYQDSSLGWDWRIYANSGGTFAARVSSGSPAPAGVFSHVVLVWDGTNASVYVNGALAAGPTPAPTFVPIGNDSGGNPARIVGLGCRSDFGYFWSGSAQEVAVYTNALSAAAIMAHYQNGTNPTPSQTYESLVGSLNPLLYWRLNDPGYTSTTGVTPVPFQPGQPTARNLGSLGTPGYDATYEPGTVAAVAGAPYARFGSNSYSVLFHGLGDAVTGDYGSVQIPALTHVTSAPNFTFTCWFYDDSFQAGDSPLIWQRGPDHTNSAMGLWFFDSAQLETMWNDQDYNSGFGNQDPPIGAWSFIASVWTPTNTTIYLNGVAKSITDTSHAPRNFSIGPIFLGADIYSDQNVNGRMQEVAMFTNALSAVQIQSLYDAVGQPPLQVVSITHSAGQLQISWQQGTLLSAPVLTGPWMPVAGATAPVYVVAPTNSQQFYRVQ